MGRDRKTKKKVGTDYCCQIFRRCIMWADQQRTKHH